MTARTYTAEKAKDTMRTITRANYVIRCGIGGVEIRRAIDSFCKVQIPIWILPLDQLRCLPVPEDIYASGINLLWRGPQLLYIGQSINLLWRGPQLLYIGQSINIDARITQHHRGHGKVKRMPFDFANAFNASEEGLDEIEYAYISAYRPPYNDKLKCS